MRVSAWSGAIVLLTALSGHAAQCSMTSNGLSFGELSPATAPGTTALGTLVITCRGKTGEALHYHLRLMAGDGSFRPRVMRNGTSKLFYNLYLDANRTQIWGDGSAGTGDLSGSLVLPSPIYSRLYPVYARLLSQSTRDEKPYFDSVVVRFEY